MSAANNTTATVTFTFIRPTSIDIRLGARDLIQVRKFDARTEKQMLIISKAHDVSRRQLVFDVCNTILPRTFVATLSQRYDNFSISFGRDGSPLDLDEDGRVDVKEIIRVDTERNEESLSLPSKRKRT